MSASVWAAAWILVVQGAVMVGAWLLARQGGSAAALLGVQAAGLALMLGGLALLRRWALRPVAQLLAQVQALGEWQFLPRKQPPVQEWVPLARAINVLIEKVQTSLHERDAAVGDLRSQLARDDLTHAASRQQFMWALDRMLQTRDAGGAAAILRVNDLEGLNQRLGRQRTDELLVAVATTVRAALLAHRSADDFTLARLNGADFGLLLPGLEEAQWRALLLALAEGLQRLSDEGLTDQAVTAWMGGTGLRQGEPVSDVLARVDNQVMQAMGRGQRLALASSEGGPRFQLLSQWRQAIEAALDTGHLGLAMASVHDAAGRLLHHHASLRLLLPDGSAVDRAELMPAALRCGRSADLDLKAVEIALHRLADPALSLSLELAPQSLARPSLQRRLRELLQAHPERAGRLTLELADLPDTSELMRALQCLGDLARQTGCGLGLRDFGVGRTTLPLLAGLPLRHAKLSARLQASTVEAVVPRVATAAAGLCALDVQATRAFAELLKTWGAQAQVTVLTPEPAAEL
jgi:predicted signal transduction protein with EAL and GGDEF domain